MRCCNPNCNGGHPRTIEDPKTAWPEMTGFARPKSQRGENSGSSLVGRQPTGRVMCSGCGVELDHGVPQGQESML